MKATKKQIKITVTEFENGHTLLFTDNQYGYGEAIFYVRTKYGITRYNEAEMKEIYNYTES